MLPRSSYVVRVDDMRIRSNENGRTHGAVGWKTDIHDYARWEYGTEEAAEWILRDSRALAGDKREPLLPWILDLFRLGRTENGSSGHDPENRRRYGKRVL